MPGNSEVIVDSVRELVEPALDDMGFELVDVEYLSVQGRWVLRLYIDKDGGVAIDDCARVSREVGDLIEVKDVIRRGYVLEVSSPGLNRPLTKEKDLLRSIDCRIKVRTSAPVKGRRNFTGYLRSFRDGRLYLEMENEQAILPWSLVQKANLVYEFDDL